MSKILVTLTEIGDFDEIIDVRTPAEYAEDRIPGAINCPVLDNEQRATIGTLYVQHSPFEARRLGGALVAENIAHHLKITLGNRPKNWRPLVYCWRGGMRSGSFVTWMRLIGWQACQLEGGYKSWRHHVLEQKDSLPVQFDFRVVCGATGSGKTALLEALADQGAQVLDLERLAAHRGSALGALPGTSQPAQKWFDTSIVSTLAAFDRTRPVFVEAESRKVGSLSLPEALVEAMRTATCIEMEVDPEARLTYLLAEYGWLGDNPEEFVGKLGFLQGLVDNATLAVWQDWARHGRLRELFNALIRLHYDPAYARSQKRLFRRYGEARRYAVQELSENSLRQLARTILATT